MSVDPDIHEDEAFLSARVTIVLGYIKAPLLKVICVVMFVSARLVCPVMLRLLGVRAPDVERLINKLWPVLNVELVPVELYH